MSNRLESLNSKKPSSSKPSLKFKPKAVERKSKAERDKHTTIKQEDDDKLNKPKHDNNRKPKPRGRKNSYSGTHVVSSGLFSSGAVPMGSTEKEKPMMTGSSSSSSTASSSTASGNNDFIRSLKLKNPGASNSLSNSESDDENDITKIDMSKEYKFENTELFPVRPERHEPEQLQTPTQVSKEQSPVKEDPEFVKETSVKSDNIETELQQILETKADLENRISQPVDLLDMEETSKMSQDHNNIVESLTNDFFDLSTDNNNDNTFMLMQLPKNLPNYKPAISQVKAEPDSENVVGEEKQEKQGEEEKEKQQQQQKESTEPNESKPSSIFTSSETSTVQGEIGQLNIHKSGKVTINLGNDINLAVNVGAPTHFLQELVSFNMAEKQSTTEEDGDNPNEDDKMDQDNDDDNDDKKNITSGNKGSMRKLGTVDGKLITTPILS